MPSPVRRSLPTLAALALLALLGPRAEAGLELPRKPYRDPVHKFSFKIFDKWQQVPIEAGEKVEVAKFIESAERGSWVTPTVKVVRIVKRPGGTQPVVTGEGGLPPEVLRRLRAGQEPTSAWDATVGQLMIPEEARPDPAAFETIESDDDVEGKLWAFEVPLYSNEPGAPRLFGVLISFEKDDVEYGIFFTSTSDRRKAYEKGMEKLAKSFRFFDDRAKEVESLDVLEGVNITAERRLEIEQGLVEGWDVIVSPKKNYIVVYDTKRDKNHPLAKEIARRIELIREQVYEVQFPPAKPITAVSIVRVCRDRKQYHAYGGPGGSAGYWNSGTEELVFYDASASQKIDFDTLAVLYHEAFHQYIYYSAGDVAPHSWYNEGHGDYYAGAKLTGSKFTIKPFAWRQGIIKNAVTHGPRAKVTVQAPDGTSQERYANDGGYTPLVDFVRFTQGEYYSYAGVCYAQGWSLVYFLREIVPRNKKQAEKWGRILPTYFDALKAAVNGESPGAAPVPRPRPPQPPPEDGDEEGGDDGAAPTGPPTTPGEDDGGEEPDDGGGDPGAWIPPAFLGGRGGPQALRKALDAAFEGVDLDELEEAWAKAVKKDM